MNTLIFSDVHLETLPEAREKADSFVEFLHGINGDSNHLLPIQPGGLTQNLRAINGYCPHLCHLCKRVIILGDLFDFWFEYRHVIFSGYFEVLRAFAELRDAGVELHLVCGNHDFWAGRFLRDELGFAIHRESVTLDFGGRRVLFTHGDGLNPADRAYRFYKKLARARPVVWLFGLLHPDWAMAIARRVSHGSRRLSVGQDPSEGAEARALSAFARETLGQGRADVVICGHAHAPVREEHPTPQGVGLYLNVGDWRHYRSYVEWDGKEFHLRQADGASISL